MQVQCKVHLEACLVVLGRDSGNLALLPTLGGFGQVMSPPQVSIHLLIDGIGRILLTKLVHLTPASSVVKSYVIHLSRIPILFEYWKGQFLKTAL